MEDIVVFFDTDFQRFVVEVMVSEDVNSGEEAFSPCVQSLSNSASVFHGSESSPAVETHLLHFVDSRPAMLKRVAFD